MLIHGEVNGIFRNFDAPLPYTILFVPMSRPETWNTAEVCVHASEVRAGLRYSPHVIQGWQKYPWVTIWTVHDLGVGRFSDNQG